MELIRKLSISILLVLFDVAYSISGEVSQDLQEKLKILKGDEYLSCLVMLKDQIVLKDLELQRKLKTHKDRHSSLIDKLKNIKEDTQGEILEYLEKQKNGGSVRSYRSFWIVNGLELSATKEETEKIALRPEVEKVSLNYPILLIAPISAEANSTKTSPIDYLQAIGVRDLWKMGYTGKNRLVCGFDTGVEWTHPALFSRWRGGVEDVNTSSWFDPNGSSFPIDANGHGTHTMGIMVGKTPSETLGVAFDAKWIAAGVIDRGRSFDQTLADILQAFEWAIDPDGNPETTEDMPDVINNSWGIPLAAKPPCDQTFWLAIDNVEAAGIAVVFAAGNEGPFSKSLRTPADRTSSPINSFSVGAVDSRVFGFPIADFSSRGPSGCDGISIKPEICAPGVEIRSSYLNGTYKALSGTSIAAPFISGAIALLKGFNPEATVEEIKNALILSSTDLGIQGEDNAYGWGLLNLKKSLDFMPAPPFPKIWLDSVYVIDDTQFHSDENKRAKIYLVLKNYGAKVNSLNLILETQDTSLALIEDSLYFDSIGSKKTEVNINAPLILSHSHSLPVDYQVSFWLKLFNSPGSYRDSLQFSLVLNPSSSCSLAEHNVGNIIFTFSNAGRFGLGKGSIFPAEGKGFRFPKSGEDNLFEGAFLVGKSKTQVSDAARDITGKSTKNDFEPEGELVITSPGRFSDQDGIGIFSDDGAENPIGLEILQRSFAFANHPDDDYVILEFTLKNKTLDTLSEIYPGLFFDWDISLSSPEDDLAGHDSVSDIPFVYQFDPVSSVYLTAALLSHSPVSCKLIDNQLSLYDGFAEEEKYQFLRGDTIFSSDTSSNPPAGDWSMISSCGPLVVTPGESLIVAFAMVAGNSPSDLKENINSAKIKYSDMRTDIKAEDETVIPTDFDLEQNHPNPFNPATTIHFIVSGSQFMVHSPIHTTLTIYNILGQRVRTLVNENKLPGRYEVIWDGKDDKGIEVASGVYFYLLEAGGYKGTKKMVLLR